MDELFLWGRHTIIKVFEKTSNPRDRVLKHQWEYDGSRQKLWIDFTVTGRLLENFPVMAKVGGFESAQTASVTIKNAADALDPKSHAPIQIGDMIEISAGYDGLDNVQPVFLGVITNIPPVEWQGTKQLTLVANDGMNDWLGKEIDKQFFRDWDVFDDNWYDGNPFTATEIASDVVNGCGINFFSGTNIGVDQPGANFKLGSQPFELDVSVADLERRQIADMGALFLETYKAVGTAAEILYDLAAKSRLGAGTAGAVGGPLDRSFFPHMIHLGDVYWNPHWSHVHLQNKTFEISNVPGQGIPAIQRRIERAHRGTPDGGNITRNRTIGEREKGTAEEIDGWAGSDWILPCTLVPEAHLGAVISVSAEAKPDEISPEEPRQRVDFVGQVRQLTIRGESDSNNWKSDLIVREVAHA